MVKDFKNKFLGFTLSELLLALGIIGIIAAVTIPSLSGNIQKRLLTSQIKSFVSDVQFLMDRQLTIHNARYLSDTDFADLNKLFSDNNFPVVLHCTTAEECWTQTYRRISDNAEVSAIGDRINEGKTVKLKNGSIVTFQHTANTNLALSDDMTDHPGDAGYGMFIVDLNGDQGPNIAGRDRFVFIVSKRGKIYDLRTYRNQTAHKLETLRRNCREATVVNDCIIYLMKNNWNMDY